MKTWLNLHLILSIFFLPLLLVYALTGVMYMAGVDGQLGNKVETYEFDLSMMHEETPGDSAYKICKANFSSEVPCALPWRAGRGGKYLLGNSAGKHVELTIDKAKGRARAELIEPGLYPAAMLIHKGKAGLWFSILGYGAAASMLILYVSGLALVWRSKGKKPLMLAAFALGMVALLAGWLML